MMATLRCKFSGGKIAPHSDLRAGARRGEVIVAIVSTPEEEKGVPRRAGPVTRSMTSAPSSNGGRGRVASGVARGAGTRGRPLRGGLGLRAVRVRSASASVRECVLENGSGAVATQAGPAAAIDDRVADLPEGGVRVKKRVRFASPLPHTRANSRPSTPPASELPRDSRAGSCASPARTPFATTGVRVMQLNMRRSAAVTGEVRQLVADKRLDVLLLQEPYVGKLSASRTLVGLGSGSRVAAVRSQQPWAAVVVSNPRFDISFVSQLSTPHCACAEVLAPGSSFYVVSCYFQYQDDIEEHLRHLEMVFRSLRGQRLLVGMDANARSSLWGPQSSDEAGERLEALIHAFGFSVVNDAGQPPTFWTARGSSYIDVTLASPSMIQLIGEWKVRCDWTTSDHRAVDVRIRVPKASEGGRSSSSCRFDTRRADWGRFAARLKDLSGSKLEALVLDSAEQVEAMAETLAEVLTGACTASMPRKRLFRKSNPWWTSELTKLKRAAHRQRRDYQRESDKPTRLVKLRKYRTSLREYSREVRRAKLVSWRKFVTESGNAEPWGFVYKQQAGKLRVSRVLSTLRRGSSSTLSLEDSARLLLDTHVPDDREEDDTPEQRVIRESAHFAPGTADAPPFTELELVAATRTFKNGKAPGPDLVEVSVLRAAVREIPGQLVRLYNGCLRWGVFPSVWKRGSLRVLLKGEDKDEKDPKSYRPICLLSAVGKLLEKLLKLRLTDTSLAPGQISDRQFGFMPGRSTEDAVVELRRMVSASEQRYVVAMLFDISGAFDNVWWPLIFDSLRRRGCPANVFGVLRSYFDGRSVSIPAGNSEVAKRATRGCPQGSVLGPACWNLVFDDLLRLLESSVGASFAAYADDLVVLVRGESRREIETRGQQVADLVSEWCSSAKLQISASKTEAIILRNGVIRRAPIGRRGGDRPDRKRKSIRARKAQMEKRAPTIRIGNANVKFKECVRYLGVHLDRDMGVRSHCVYLRDKVGSLFGRLSRVARCRWGLRFGALSEVYRGVFVPTVAYAAAGWADLCSECDLRILRSLQHRVLLAVTGAYRTASWEALCVLAGVAPVDIALRERRALYYVRKGEDTRMGDIAIPRGMDGREAVRAVKGEAMKMWQASWVSSQNGRTTFAFFGDVRERMEARWVTVGHCTAQVLTGHGDFRERLASLGLVAGGGCACGGGPDTAVHHLVDCPSFDPQREALREMVPVGEWSWPRVARALVSAPESFSLFADFCAETLLVKGSLG